MASMTMIITGLLVMIGSATIGYERDPTGSLPVALLFIGFVVLIFGIGRNTRRRGDRSEGRS